MIVTVTPNPSLDRTLELERLALGEVNRASVSRLDAGGKGVNVARALRANGHAVRAVLPVGGREGEQLVHLLRELGLDVRGVPVAAPIRENVSLVEPDGRVTKVNAPGPQLAAGEVAALIKATVTALDGASWVAASGSLPPGAPDDLYAQLLRDVIAAGHDAGNWVGVCGEAASDPTVAAALVGLGIDELSMTRVAIPEVKDTLRGLTSDACRAAVERAIDEAGDGTEARGMLEGALDIEPPPYAGKGL